MLATYHFRDAMLSGLEEVLVTSTEDICMHRAYAGALIAARDPIHLARGRFIETQLKLEETLTPEDRRKLQGRERKLLRDHGRAWLAELSEWLFDRENYRFCMARGWLTRIEMDELDPVFLRLLLEAPQARLVREIVITCEPSELAALHIWLESGFLHGLRLLVVNGQGEGENPAVVLHRLVEA